MPIQQQINNLLGTAAIGATIANKSLEVPVDEANKMIERLDRSSSVAQDLARSTADESARAAINSKRDTILRMKQQIESAKTGSGGLIGKIKAISTPAKAQKIEGDINELAGLPREGF